MALHLRKQIFVSYFCPALNLSFEIHPFFFILFCMALCKQGIFTEHSMTFFFLRWFLCRSTAIGHSVLNWVHCGKLLDHLRFTRVVCYSCSDISSLKTASVLTVRLTHDKLVLCYYQGHAKSTCLYRGTAQQALYQGTECCPTPYLSEGGREITSD